MPFELRQTKRKAPPTLRWISQVARAQPANTPNQRLSSARFVRESNTSARGALKTRDIAISRSPDAETFRAMFSMFIPPHRVMHGGCLRRSAPTESQKGTRGSVILRCDQ